MKLYTPSHPNRAPAYYKFSLTCFSEAARPLQLTDEKIVKIKQVVFIFEMTKALA